MLDLLIIKPGAQRFLYQKLSSSISAIEPPLWGLLLANFIRQNGFQVQIKDAEIDTIQSIQETITTRNPKLIAIVVSGTNPSASTMNMVGATAMIRHLRQYFPGLKIILIGLHPSALPEQTLRDENVDYVCEGEGFETTLLWLQGSKLEGIPGLWYKEGLQIKHQERACLVDPNRMPMPAWDLVDLNRYRAHNWHCFGSLDQRQPYAVIYTSLGCPYHCDFCCIHAIFGQPNIRYRSINLIMEEVDLLVNDYHVKNIKILDECFVLDQQHVLEFCEAMIRRKYSVNMWAYARINTINEKILLKMKAAGFRWIGYGIESGTPAVLSGVHKAQYDNQKIFDVVKLTKKSGLNVGGNFIFGLPNDNIAGMRRTLALAVQLNCEYANFYTAMAYPGSKLYDKVRHKAGLLPRTWEGYSQFGTECFPLRNDFLTQTDILAFRDQAFIDYFSRAEYLDMIERKFGSQTMLHINKMTQYKLKRTLLEVDQQQLA
ncbi:MAG: B12-binding domain-containing radical SAM protein [Candidatus Omnitrophica bacterium]|nr:B12-binding domain-containing radical SAM protein [Candidatus Omnitrophota bacterium]